MTNGGIIEGGSTLRVGSSDLSPATFFPNGSMRVFHGAGTTDEEIAGQHNNIASLPFSCLSWQCRLLAGSGGGKGLWPVVALKQTPPHYRRNPLNPYAEKEARLRPQQIFLARAGWDKGHADAHVRGIAVAQRLCSDLFRGAGRPARKCEATTVRGDCSSRQPAPLTFL
jgi:hypothetical protein